MTIGSLQTTLGDLVESGEGFIQTGPFGSQLHAHDYVENGIPVVMPQQLGDNEISEYGTAQINEQDRDRLIRHVMRVGDIVFSRRGDVTRRAYITGKEDGWLCGTGCLLLRLNHPQCDNRYLVRFLGLHETRSYLTQHAIGATMPNLNQRILASVPVVLPPREHQERIIGVISAYDDLIENNRRRIQLLEQAARLLYKEWFVHLRFPGHEDVKIIGGLPEGWEDHKLGDLITKVKRPRKVRKEDYLEKGSIPCVDQSRSFVGGYTEEAEAEITSPLPLVVFGDHTRVLKFIDFPFACGADGTQLLYPKDDRLSIQYFYFAVDNIDLSNYFYARHFKFLKDQKIFVPSANLMAEFTDFAKNDLKQISVLRKANHNLARVRDLLLPRLMNGEITI